MVISASINRLGPGIGVSGGVSFIFVTGVSNPQKLNGHQQGSWDFNLSIGPAWGKMAQSAGKAKKLQPLIEAVGNLGVRTPSGLKAALKTHPDKWVQLIKAGKSVVEYLGIDPAGEPNVFVFDVPFAGGGTEASVFYGLSNFNAVWDSAD